MVAAVAVPLVSTATQMAEAGTFTVNRLLNQLPVRRERNAGYDRGKFADWQDRIMTAATPAPTC